MSDVPTLLADYAQRGSEAAFRELVARYTDLVYSTALRLFNGDAHAAQDIAQTVFLDLARKAGHLSPQVTLGGWLHRHTCFVAATALRGQRRRQARERIAAAMNTQDDHAAANLAAVAPVLDDAINQLAKDDRDAIVLRFFEQLDFRALGARLGASDDAARMRVNRALDKLHAILKNHGVAFSFAALGTALAAEAVKAAPVGLAAILAGNALSGLAPGTTVGVAKMVGLAKLKLALAAAVALSLVATPLLLQHQSLLRAHSENQQLRQQLDQFAALQADNDRLNAQLASNHEPSLSEPQIHELARLRAEVGFLRDRTNSLAKTIAYARSPLANAEFYHGKLVFRGISMDQFAEYLSGVLRPRVKNDPGLAFSIPVTNETGLAGTYDIAITPLHSGPISEILPRTTNILKSELGLDLAAAARMEVFPVSISGAPQLASLAHDSGVERPRATTIPLTQYALRVANSDAAGLKPASHDPDPFGLIAADETLGNSAGSQSASSSDPAGVLGPNDAAAQNACINNLRLIDAAKQQWALEKGMTATNIPTMDDIAPYIRPGPNGELPSCPAGGAYIIGRVLDRPTCSVPGHALP